MKEVKSYRRVIERIDDWPIYKLSKEKKEFTDLFVERSLEAINHNFKDLHALEDELVKVIYLENIRLKQNPWKVDTKEEKAFWKYLKTNLVNRSQQSIDQRDQTVYKKIITQYATEIIGNFNKGTYEFAEKATNQGFMRLFSPTRLFSKSLSPQEEASKRIKVLGEVDAIRKLATKGTIVLLPTHHSNLDSILIGWALNHIGLPAFLYGAGLNLFNNPVMEYYFDRLGAYKIDRRKKNAFYLETLKMYSKLTIQRGCHTLFFPGGTRSRSGELEKKLKLGLLSTVVDAQQLNFTNPINSSSEKIFIVPLIISYHFVLEANQLIDQHLKMRGKEKYFTGKDSIPSTTKFLNFFRQLISSKSDVGLNFGKPMDIFGNDVDEDTGNSIDLNGNHVDIKDYFISNGKITHDNQRTSEYTRMLASKVSERFYSENVVLTSHLCAYAAYQILKKRHRRLDIYGLMRLPKEDRVIPFNHYLKVVEIIKSELIELEKQNKLILSKHLRGNNLERMIKYGLRNSGIYHNEKPVYLTKHGDISSENMKLLYFYHNRMKGYGISNNF